MKFKKKLVVLSTFFALSLSGISFSLTSFIRTRDELGDPEIVEIYDLYVTTSVYSNILEKQFKLMAQKLIGLNCDTINIEFSSEFTIAKINEVYKIR